MHYKEKSEKEEIQEITMWLILIQLQTAASLDRSLCSCLTLMETQGTYLCLGELLYWIRSSAMCKLTPVLHVPLLIHQDDDYENPELIPEGPVGHHKISANRLYVPQIINMKPWRGTEPAKDLVELLPSRAIRQLKDVGAFIY